MLVVHSLAGSLNVLCSSNQSEAIITSNFTRVYIPGVSFDEDLEQSSPTLVVGVGTTAFSLAKGGWKLVLGKNANIESLIVVLGYCLEYCRQLHGQFMMHGTAALTSRGAVLFIGGASGIGKTSSAIELAKLEGTHILADDRVVVSSTGDVVSFNSQLHFNKQILETRYTVTDILMANEKLTTPVYRIVQPVTYPDSSLDVIEDPWDSNKSKFHLYEELSRSIRGVSKTITDDYPLISLDTVVLANERMLLAALLSTGCTVSTLYGSPETIANFVSRV